MSTDNKRRAIAVAVAVTYVLAGVIMMSRADDEWAMVQFCLAYLSFLTLAI